MCNDNWNRDLANARVACRELSAGYPRRAYSVTGGDNAEPIWLDDVTCNGDESSLAECPRGVAIGDSNCEHREDIAVECLAKGKWI